MKAYLNINTDMIKNATYLSVVLCLAQKCLANFYNYDNLEVKIANEQFPPYQYLAAKNC